MTDADVAAALDRLATIVTNENTDRVEAHIPALVTAFEDAGVDVVVLKGPVTRRRNYESGERRPVADIDVLVDPSRFRRASRVLTSRGYRRVDRHGHSDAFAGGVSDPDVDLHLTLPYVRLAPAKAWKVFAAHRTGLDVDGATLPVLDEPAHTVHLAIHAAVNRFDPGHRSLEEWRRGYATLDDDARAVAEDIAADLGVQSIWSAAVHASSDTADRVALAASLPVWEAVPRVRSLHGYIGSGTPLWVKWRDFQRLATLQWSDDTVNKWRGRRGRAPLPPGGWRIRIDKPVRLVAVSCAGMARLVGIGEDPAGRPRTRK